MFSYEQARVRTSTPGGNPLLFVLPVRVWKKLILMGRFVWRRRFCRTAPAIRSLPSR
jgi:hypothetical protein